MSQERRPISEAPRREMEAGVGGVVLTGTTAALCESTEDREAIPLMRDKLCEAGGKVGLSPVESYLVLGAIFGSFVIHGGLRLAVDRVRRNRSR